jgi:hypothetical protein
MPVIQIKNQVAGAKKTQADYFDLLLKGVAR